MNGDFSLWERGFSAYTIWAETGINTTEVEEEWDSTGDVGDIWSLWQSLLRLYSPLSGGMAMGIVWKAWKYRTACR